MDLALFVVLLHLLKSFLYTEQASGYVDVKKPISSSIKKKADYKPSAQPSAQASAQPEVLYIDRDQPRGTDRDQPRGTDRDQPRGGYTDRDKPDSFYTRGNKPEGEYVGRDAMAPPVPNRHGLSQYNPPVPPKQFTKDPNGEYAQQIPKCMQIEFI